MKGGARHGGGNGNGNENVSEYVCIPNPCTGKRHRADAYNTKRNSNIHSHRSGNDKGHGIRDACADYYQYFFGSATLMLTIVLLLFVVVHCVTFADAVHPVRPGN